MTPDAVDLAIARRLMPAYDRMRRDQTRASEFYKPSSMWEDLIGRGFRQFRTGVEWGDTQQVAGFLANFGTWHGNLGIEHGVMLARAARSPLRRRAVENDIFLKLLRRWRWWYGDRKPVAELSHPRFGNQPGALIDGTFVTIGSFFSEIYGSMFAELLAGTDRPVLAELGAGYGKLAYFVLRRLQPATFVDFDLPEMVCLAAYYLLRCFPERSALLYGEEPYDPSLHGCFDLIFMPGFDIERLGGNSVDLFTNVNSLGEMTSQATKTYLRYMAASTRFLFHMNHERIPNIYEDRSRSLLGYEYGLSEMNLRPLVRYPDLGHFLLEPMSNSDIFFYLYEKNRDAERPPTS